MSFRFRKSVKIAPGVRINFSKSGVSTSIGKRGAMVNISKRGTRVTTGLPGTGLSYSKLYKSQQRPAIEASEGGYGGYSKLEWIVSLIMLAVILLVFSYLAEGPRRLILGSGSIISFLGAVLLAKSGSKNKTELTPLVDIVPDQHISTSTWQERAAAVGALVDPTSKNKQAAYKQKTTTSGDLLVSGGLQAMVDGVPTYHLSNQKDNLDVMAKCAVAEIENYWNQTEGARLCAAPFFFERAAILYRKAKQHTDEVRICEAWVGIVDDYSQQDANKYAQVHLGAKSQAILKRMPKALDLRAKAECDTAKGKEIKDKRSKL